MVLKEGIIMLDYEEEIIQKGELRLERLLLNIRGQVIVNNKDNNLYACGTEQEVMEKVPEWLDLLVYDISIKNNKIKIVVTSEDI